MVYSYCCIRQNLLFFLQRVMYLICIIQLSGQQRCLTESLPVVPFMSFQTIIHYFTFCICQNRSNFYRYCTKQNQLPIKGYITLLI